jgi:hypothetical protein
MIRVRVRVRRVRVRIKNQMSGTSRGGGLDRR